MAYICTKFYTGTKNRTPQAILPSKFNSRKIQNGGGRHFENHRLRGSASPVLTATRHSYGSPKLSDFFPAHRWKSDRPTDFDVKWLKRHAFTQRCAFCSKNRNFPYPLISRAPKGSKFRKILDLENFSSLDLAFDVRGPERERERPPLILHRSPMKVT